MPWKGTSTWEPEHDAALRSAVAAGMSMGQAADDMSEKFDRTFTRNACCGRAHRLGIKGDAVVSANHRTAAALTRKPRKVIPKPSFGESLLAQRCIDLPSPRHISLFELDATTCRWPYGDSNFTFCGQPVFAGCSYCEPHAALSVGPGTGQERAAHRVAA